MSENTLAVQSREGRGRGPARRLRKSGRIPAVIYGPSGSRSLSIDEKELRILMRKLHGSASIIEVADDKGGKTSSILQEVSRDPLTDEFVHVDLQEVSADHEITVSVQLHVTGEASGVKNEGGVLDVVLHEVEIRCLPKNLPESIELDITELAAGEGIHVSDLKPIPGVTFLGDPATVLVTCAAQSGKAEEEEVAEAEAATEEKPAEGGES